MKIISPCLDLEAEATQELLSDCIRRLNGKSDPFIILEDTELTYMQCLWTKEGYDLEYQEENIYNHYKVREYISEEDVISTMQDYLLGNPAWRTRFQFEKKEFSRFSFRVGYRLGQFAGLIKRSIRKLKFMS